jgi:hypothetical protein
MRSRPCLLHPLGSSRHGFHVCHWIHANCCIPSSLHQFLIQRIDDEVELVHADASAYIALADETSNYVIPGFIPKPSTHRMHDPGSIVSHIQPKVFTDNQKSQIKYNYYINNVSKDYDYSQRNRIMEDSITPQERQPGQHVA